MVTLEDIAQIIVEVLQLDAGASDLYRETRLLGAVPEFDSMAVVSVLTAVEDNYGITIEDDELTAEVFETLGTLVDFVSQQVGE